ncbi:MAG: hypothetical protein Q4D62_13625 [Planctomycetia bacterium]|nr:hypothetical protein [Planctomycetia bacterium]
MPLNEDRIRQHTIGCLALFTLLCGVILWLLGYSQQPQILPYYSICWRLGPVLALWWLAWNQLKILPAWAYLSVPMVLVALVINRKLVLLAIPLAILLSLLNHPWLKRGRKRRKP